MNKHTPGPWSLQESATHVRIVGADGENIWHEDKRCPRVMDDARLIASAPELLMKISALIGAAEYLQARVLETRGANCMDNLDAAIYEAKAAIHKATVN